MLRMREDRPHWSLHCGPAPQGLSQQSISCKGRMCRILSVLCCHRSGDCCYAALFPSVQPQPRLRSMADGTARPPTETGWH